MCMKCGECKAGQGHYCAKKTHVYHDTFKNGCPAPLHGGFANRIRLFTMVTTPLLCDGLTIFTALRKYGAGANKMVGVKGIGTLGHFAIQYAKAMGSKDIVAINGSDITFEDVTKLGATRCIDLSNKDGFQAEHRKIDLLLVNSFNESTNWEVDLSLVSNHGTVVVLALSKVPMSIPTMPLAHRDIRIVLSFQGGRNDVKEMLAFTVKQEIHLWIVKVQFDKINDANESKEKESNAEANKAWGWSSTLKED
ncbi:hypothetical protein KI688_009240 [Linnemannia hyalina]|uniref:Alcohol dehydrogenase-like C-terminal domain-containing protein n=1 Tax=Linnemannia hyalina TaxID=64524 RepID=A0A9P7XYY6_9FUNG|nr:hypothetical protein KI688_009240 [Linnemannia hyalina]